MRRYGKYNNAEIRRSSFGEVVVVRGAVGKVEIRDWRTTRSVIVDCRVYSVVGVVGRG